MIKVNFTPELVTDLLTPGVCGPMVLTDGLPKGVKLINVEYKDDIVEYTFDDGKAETTIGRITYSRLE